MLQYMPLNDLKTTDFCSLEFFSWIKVWERTSRQSNIDCFRIFDYTIKKKQLKKELPGQSQHNGGTKVLKILQFIIY